MRIFIAALAGLMGLLNANAQFDMLKPISDEEIARNKQHKIAAVTTTTEVSGKLGTSVQKFNTAGQLT